MSAVFCKSCGPVYPNIQPQKFLNGTTHLRADCPKCGHFIKWLRQMPEGRYQGHPLINLSEAYMRYVLDSDKASEKTKQAVRQHLDELKPVIAEPPQATNENC
jgi:hypothetical protein